MIDVETTGLDSARDEIISVGVVAIHEGRVVTDRWYRLVRPERPPSAGSMTVHALMPADLQDAPPLREVLAELRQVVEGTAVVAHAAWIERAFIDRALRHQGQRLPATLIDTAVLAEHCGLGVGGSHAVDLEWLASELGLPVYAPHHALGDALTTALVLLALVARLEQRKSGPLSTARLVELSARPPG